VPDKTDDAADLVRRSYRFLYNRFADCKGHIDHRFENVLDRCQKGIDISDIHRFPPVLGVSQVRRRAGSGSPPGYRRRFTDLPLRLRCRLSLKLLDFELMTV
jgi:hypothetical protein